MKVEIGVRFNTVEIVEDFVVAIRSNLRQLNWCFVTNYGVY